MRTRTVAARRAARHTVDNQRGGRSEGAFLAPPLLLRHGSTIAGLGEACPRTAAAARPARVIATIPADRRRTDASSSVFIGSAAEHRGRPDRLRGTSRGNTKCVQYPSLPLHPSTPSLQETRGTTKTSITILTTTHRYAVGKSPVVPVVDTVAR